MGTEESRWAGNQTDAEIGRLTDAAAASARGHAEDDWANERPEPAWDDPDTAARLYDWAEREAEDVFDRWDDEARAAAKEAGSGEPVTGVGWSDRSAAIKFHVETMLAEYRRLWREAQ